MLRRTDRTLGRVLLLTAAAALGFHWGRALLFPPPPPDAAPLLPVACPDASSFSERGGTPPRWTARTEGPGGPLPVGAVVSSGDLAPGVRGYAGPVPVLVGVTPQGRITGVALLPNRETPAYADRLAQGPFLRQFAGKAATDPLRLGEDLDGVTRATVTAQAVAEGVRASARAAARDVHGLRLPPEPAPPARRWGAADAAVPLVVALGVLSLLVPRPALRRASLLAGLVVLGFWRHTYLSLEQTANLLLGRHPPLAPEQFGWWIVLAASVVAALLGRSLWCSRLCPFGALQEAARLLTGVRLPATADEERDARRLRVAFLWLAAMAVFLLDLPAAAGYEPFATAFDRRGGPLRWALLAAVLLFAAVRHRFWCRYLCPTGTCLQLLGRMRWAQPFEEREQRAAPAGGDPGAVG